MTDHEAEEKVLALKSVTYHIQLPSLLLFSSQFRWDNLHFTGGCARYVLGNCLNPLLLDSDHYTVGSQPSSCLSPVLSCRERDTTTDPKTREFPQ